MELRKIFSQIKIQKNFHWLISIITFGIIFLNLLPGGFVQTIVTIDHFFSSQHMFEYAFQHGFSFGINIIDNVGPYGHLHYPYTYAGGVFWEKILWFGLICAIYAYYAVLLLRDIKTLPEKCLFIFAIIFFPLQIDFPWYAFEILPRLAVLFSALYLLSDSVKKNSLGVTLHIIFNSLFYALLVLEKASNVYYLMFLIAILVFYWTINRQLKKPIYLLTAFTSSVVLLWIISGQKLTGLFIYFQSMQYFIDAYQSILTMEVTSPDLIYALIYCAIIGSILLIRILISVLVTSSWEEVFRSLLIAALTFLSWKHGILRSSLSYGTFLYITPCLVAFLCFYPIAGLDKRKRKDVPFKLLSNQFYFLFTCGFYVIFLLIVWNNITSYEQQINPKRTMLHEFQRRFLSLTHYRPTKTLQILKEQFSILKQKNMMPISLKEAIGLRTIDEFGSTPELIFLNDLHYSPRPVPIEFIVGNRALNEKNGRYYQQLQSAPDFVLLPDFTMKLSDSLAYLTLLLNYHVRDQFQDWLVLEKNIKWNTIHLQKISKKQMPISRWIFLENLQSFFTWIKIDLQPTILGKLKNFLYKSDKVRLDVWLDNDVIQQYEVSLSQLRSGFLINPIIKSKDPAKHSNYQSTPWDRVKAFRITMISADKQYLFRPDYQVAFSKVDVATKKTKLTSLSLMKAQKQIIFLRERIIIPIKKMSIELIIGPWKANGKEANITMDKGKLLIHNEAGTSSVGQLSSNHLFLLAPNWNNIKATLSKDGKELKWSNGTSWKR